MKIKYLPKNFAKSSLALIEKANEIIRKVGDKRYNRKKKKRSRLAVLLSGLKIKTNRKDKRK